MNRTLAIDADGVILDFLGQWEIACQEKLGVTFEQVSHEYDLTLRYGMTKKEVNTVWHHFNEAGHWRKMRGFQGVAQAIHDLDDLGFRIHIVTSIDQSLLEDRRSNFANVGLPAHLPIHCVSGTKLHKLQEIDALCLVDDYAFHIEEAKTAGIPYRVMIKNGKKVTPSRDATHFMHSLQEFATSVKSGFLLPLPKISASQYMLM